MASPMLTGGLQHFLSQSLPADPPTTGTCWLGGASSWAEIAALTGASELKFFGRIAGDTDNDVAPYLGKFDSALIAFSWDGGMAVFQANSAATSGGIVTFGLLGGTSANGALLVMTGTTFPSSTDAVGFNFQLIGVGTGTPGPAGADGADGQQGIPGIQGNDGTDGRDAGEAIFVSVNEPVGADTGDLWYDI